MYGVEMKDLRAGREIRTKSRTVTSVCSIVMEDPGNDEKMMMPLCMYDQHNDGHGPSFLNTFLRL